MKVSDLLNAKSHVESLIKKEMDVASALEVARFAKEAAEEYREFETKRIELVRKFGTQKEDGSFVVDDPEKREKCQKGIDKLINKEVKVSPIDTELCKFVISPADIIAFSNIYE